MVKLFQPISFISLSILLLLTGCKIQPPTPTNREIGTGWGEDMIPSGVESGWGLDPRDPNSVIDAETGMYNGRMMVEDILENVLFSFDSYAISSSERPKLQAAADYLSANPKDGLLIEGHCDWHGTEDYNLALGDRRAKSARDYLVTLGIGEDRIQTLSKGSLEATTGLSKAEAKQDRRAELIVLQ